ncbi:hypothetical protein HCH_06891 [Hahella chejuensis KCTC 2396]|uniref:Uncharacterized protein n=1 Tax=Hahella chejuensis (strain KCTC 2396) TaxID=349521 RepID=Q2S765_HAHCH|nr:hypothetical protein HCH_06891 [Hahella chejuensis KCTC 2396]
MLFIKSAIPHYELPGFSSAYRYTSSCIQVMSTQIDHDVVIYY